MIIINACIALGIMIVICAIVSIIAYRGYIKYIEDYDDNHI